MNRDPKIGVHQTHCCVEHGCKYGEMDCPVALGTVTQDYPCEDCDDVLPTVQSVGMREVHSHCLYKHYKGKFYYVMGLAEHTETHELMVIYHALYGDNETYVRPMDMFLSEVEDGIDNPTGQVYRFELAQEI
jgi:hypothetical protein